MVTQVSRPKRLSAVEGVKRATQTLTGKAAARTASDRSAAKAAPKLRRDIQASLSDSGAESSELSDLDEDEQSKINSEEGSEAEEPSESEAEADKTSDYEEAGGNTKRKRSAKPSKATTPKTKRARQSNSAAKAPRTKATTVRKAAPVRSKGKQVGSKEELPVHEDNKIFNDVKNTETDLQTTAQEWVEYYQDNPGMAMAQLVNFILRSAACNSTIDEVQVLDHDSITDILDEVQESLKTEAMPSYPLVSRAASYRKFARRLSDWTEKLFTSADEADIVYDETMMETLTAWISAMSSSALRSLRHTSTYIVLLLLEQINRMSRNNAKEIQAAVNSRDAEKRKGSAANKVRLRDLEAKVKAGNQIKKQLKGFHQELLDTVFIHRYRDSDPNIRADCMNELGRWMKTYPDQYLSTSYFRYFGWMLSDQDGKVRLVTIKALDSLYTRHDYEGPLQQFTERFLPRMTEMATIDVDLQVRVAAISTLTHIDQQGALDEEGRDSLALHIFDVEPKVRSAVAGFIKGTLDEQLQETEGSSEEQEVKKLRWKYTAELLARLASRLDTKQHSEQLDAEAALNIGEVAPSRITMAISASLDVDEELQDWKSLLELLLYDHTQQQQTKPRGRKAAPSQAPPKEAYRLLPEEETILLEVLSHLVLHYKTQSESSKDEADLESYSAITRDLVPVMSQLFNKYKTEVGRINEVLTVARLIKLDTYVEFQELGAFEALWDNVIDQFQRHVEVTLLSDAVKAISAMSTMSSLSNINAAKLAVLQDSLIQTLRESVADMYSVENDHINEEDVHRVTACTRRIKHLIQCTDLSSDLNSPIQETDVESGNDGQTSSNAWSILLSFVKRGLRGDASEESMIADTIVTLSLAAMWSLRNILATTEDEEKEEASRVLCDQRARLMEALNVLIKPEAAQIVPLQARRAAFQQLVDLHILFASAGGQVNDTVEEDAEEEAPSNPLRLECDSTAQKTLAAFVKSELARYAKDVQTAAEQEADAEEGDDGAGNDNESQINLKRRGSVLPALHRQMDFIAGLSHYLGAIRLGIVHARYSIPLLSQYGRMGSVYDACLRVLVENVRLVGIQDDKPELACSVIIESLWEAHRMLCEDADNGMEMGFVNLAKMLSSALVVRGAQLAVLKGIDGEAVKHMHNKGMRLVLARLAENGDEELQPRILCFFKALSQLLVSVGPREAVAIKRDMDGLVAHYEIEVPMASKAWDAIRQYEKRLVTIASKSDSVKRHVEATRAAGKTNKARQSAADRPVRDAEEGSERAEEQGDITMNADSYMEEQTVGDETRQEHQLDLTLPEDDDDEQDASGEGEEEAEED